MNWRSPGLWVLFFLSCGGPDPASPSDVGTAVDMGFVGPDAAVDLGPAQDLDQGNALDFTPATARLGGDATLNTGDRPFATLLDNLPLETFQRVSRGREFFVADWEPNNTGRELLNGLGPMFHTTSCAGCHPPSGRPPSLLDGGGVGPGLLLRLQRVSDGVAMGPDPVYGSQLQPLATSGVPREGTPLWAQNDDEFSFHVETLGYGPLHDDTRLGPRLSPQLTGMGLLDRVPSELIREREDPDDADGDGISGRVNWLDADQTVFGRYGWKANVATLDQQVAGAFRSDMGLTSSLSPVDDCTESQSECVATPHGGAPEVDADAIEAVSSYLHMLAVPERNATDEGTLRAGYAQFVAVGCESCHRATLHTRAAETDALSDQTIHPFTDLLLHDMGPGLADGIPDGSASGAEWRTPPLWGVGRVAREPASRFLHDGRAATIHEAIRAHGGEASDAALRYTQLPSEQREALLAFLHSL